MDDGSQHSFPTFTKRRENALAKWSTDLNYVIICKQKIPFYYFLLA